MKIIDNKLKHNVKRYIFQCFLATVTILLLLVFLNLFTQATIIASLGATTFIVFTSPSAYSSERRALIGGYTIGIAVGVICYYISYWFLYNNIFLYDRMVISIIGALGVGITMLIMVVTDTEHPPAVGMCLAMVLSDWDYITLIFVLVAVTIMSLVKKLLKNVLIDLR